MTTMTPSTFNPLLGYVNVRLAQGVPIVDADWNELDDVRKFELRAFLKWYVGDGVPEGNDGFRITGGPANDFTITTGASPPPNGASAVDTALRHVGRAIVDGLDVLIEQDIAFSAQLLHSSQPGASALAQRLGVPVIAALTTPATDSQFLAYLDVWERLVTPDEQPALVHPGLGVETCSRMRRDWAVRVREGTTVPQPADADFLPGHACLPLALLNRRAGVATITTTDIRDRRQRRLLTPPAHLLTDTLGVDPTTYRQGEGRPPISLREAINALLAGQLPSTPDLPISPAQGNDLVRRAFAVDASGALVTVWQSPRAGNTNQIFGSRLDPTNLDAGFSAAEQLSTGTARSEPTAVALPDGDIVIAYQNGLVGASTTDVMMKRAPFSGLSAATEQPVAATAGAADQAPFAVLAGEHVVFLTHRASDSMWYARRYRHADATFVDASPQLMSNVSSPNRDLHAAAVAGAKVWAAFTDIGNLRLLRYDAATGAADPAATASVAAVGVATPFVLGISATEALVFFASQVGLQMIQFSATAWGAPVAVPGTDSTDLEPAAVRAADGSIFLLSRRSTADAGDEIFLRRRDPVAGLWGLPQRVISHAGNDQRPHPVLVPGQGIWVLWMSNRNGNFDLFAKRIITAI